jgi:hypothetical protein
MSSVTSRYRPEEEKALYDESLTTSPNEGDLRSEQAWHGLGRMEDDRTEETGIM